MKLADARPNRGYACVVSSAGAESDEHAEGDEDARQTPIPVVLHDAAGVDLSQIDWMLSLSPRERLRALTDYTESLARLMSNGPRH
jgi:hypothetical protein